MANEFKIKKGLIVTGASGGTVVDIQGSQGQLFSVTDNLSGSIFAVSDISGVPIFDVNSSGLSTFSGNVTIGSVDASVGEGLNIGNASPTIQLFDTTNDAKLLLYTQDTNSVIGTYSNHNLFLFTNSTEALKLDTNQFATFASGIIANGNITSQTTGGAGLNLRRDDTSISGTNTLGSISFQGDDPTDGTFNTGAAIFGKADGSWSSGAYPGQLLLQTRNTSGSLVTALTLAKDQNATFSTQAFATTATSSGDASSTLTTKGYVDSLITGATIYRGTWDPDVSLNSGYGNPNLNTVTQTSGYYYICSADGTATPNGATTEPNSWNTGDWVIWNDDIGTSGEWQKIDNSSVLSGVGTGQTVALWEGASSVTDSETLGNAPITVSGNNTTFTGDVIIDDGSGASPRLILKNSTDETWEIFNGTHGVLNFYENSDLRLSFAQGGDATFASNVKGATFNSIENAASGGFPTSKDYLLAGTGDRGGGLIVNDVPGARHAIAAGGYDLTFSKETDNGSGTLGQDIWMRANAASAAGDVTSLEFFKNASFAGATFAGDVMVSKAGAAITINSTSGAEGALHIGRSVDTKAKITSGDTAASDLCLYTNGTRALTILSNQNATFAGDATLTNGQLTVTHDTNNVAKIIQADTNLGNNSYTFEIDSSAQVSNMSAAGAMAVDVNSGRAFTITGAGNVGIGVTSNTTHKLIVSGGSNIASFRSEGSGQNLKKLSISTGGDRVVLDASTTADATTNFAFQTGGTERMRIDMDGNVGIGTTSPDALLDIGVNNIITLDDTGSSTGFIGMGSYNDGTKNRAQGASYYGFGLEIDRPNQLISFNSYASTGITTNGTNILVLKRDGKVGIGTASPNALLEISGIRENQIRLTSYDTTAAADEIIGGIEFYSSDAGNEGIKAKISAFSTDATGSAYLSFFTGTGQEQMRISNAGSLKLDAYGAGTLVSDASGNITVSSGGGAGGPYLPLAGGTITGNLTVNGTTTLGNQLTFPYGYLSDYIYHTGDSNTYFGFVSNDNFIVATSGAERIRIDSSGNVGIGTTGPIGKLNVSKDSTTDGLSQAITVSSSSVSTKRMNLGYVPGSNYAFIDVINYAISNTNQALSLQPNGGNVGIGTTSPNAKLDIQGTQGQLFSVTDDLSGEIFAVADISGVPIMTVNSSGVSYFDGNVGIGTTSPTAPLHIEGGTNSEVLKIEADSNPFVRWVENGTNVGFLQFLGDNAYLSNMSNGSFFFRTNNTDKMTILAGGNVGIGTTGPQNKLHVIEGTSTWETAEFQSSSTTGCGVTLVGANVSGLQWSMIANASSGGAGVNNLGFHLTGVGSSGGSAGYKMTIEASSGNVGIGTTSPSEKLDVRDGTITSRDSGNVNYAELDRFAGLTLKGNGAGAKYISTPNTDDLGFKTNNAEKMRITSGGNVGIGITNPAVPLDVEGKIRSNDSSSGDYLEIFCDGSVSGDSYIENTSNNIQIKSAFATSFSTSGSVAMFIKDNQNVGIGTTSPAVKLHIKGAANGTDGKLYITEDASNGSFFKYDGATNRGSLGGLSTGGEGKVIDWSRTGSEISFLTGNAEKMRVDSTGNVGIGTTSPSRTLHVSTDSGVLIKGASGSTNAKISLLPASGGRQYDLGNVGSDFRIFDASANVTRMYFDNDGNTGIGTTSPGAKLDVAGIIFAGDGNKATPGYSFASDPDTGMFRDSANVLVLGVNADTRIRISNTDIVTYKPLGVNTTSITSGVALDVGGNVLLGSSGVGDLYLGNYATANHFRFHTNNSNTYFDMNCGDIYWRQGASTRYTFFPSTANMTVNGTITQLSDIRNKENIVEISDCISKVKAMRGVYYNRTDFNTDVTKVGVIAQEVEAVLPELVLESPETGLKSVAYSELTSVLINAIKEQQEIIEDLKTRITKLEN